MKGESVKLKDNNNSNKNVTVSLGGGFTGLLTIVFIVLKLIGQIQWSWIWVLSPLWLPWGIIIAIILLMLLIGLIWNLISWVKDRW